MKKRKWLWTIAVMFIFSMLLFIGFEWWAPSLSAETLTEEEANKAAIEKYPGKIVKTMKTSGEYKIEMELETGVYHIRIDEKSGEVISIKRKAGSKETPVKQLTQKQIEEKISSQGKLESIDLVQENDKSYYKAIVTENNEKITMKLDPYTGSIIDSTTETLEKPETPSIITETEAIKIAQEHLNGKGDDVEFHQLPEQTPYYLVEVETEDDREAVVQIDAYTRKVKSVTWEDQEDGEDDAE
jgi:uncharacterized membrane protein YkoI